MVCGGGHVHDEPEISSLMTERAAYLPFVHEHAVRSALCQVEKRGAHVPDAGKRSHGDAVIHGYDNGAVVVAVKDAFKPDLFSEIHGLSPLRRQAGVRVAKKKDRRLSCMPAVFCFCLAEWDSAELPATGFSKVRKIEPAGKAGVLGKGNGGSGKVHTEKPLKNNGQKLIKKLFFCQRNSPDLFCGSGRPGCHGAACRGLLYF